MVAFVFVLSLIVGDTLEYPVYELEEIVVTATKIEEPRKKIGKSITVITEEEIKREAPTTVLELLRNLPGLDVVQTGGIGGLTSIFLRGADPEHTLVLLNGIELNDPISPGKSFDFAYLTVDNIERIEIVRGPQSALYGSEAMGGVVNIITKEGGKGLNLKGESEAGMYNTLLGRVGLSGGTEKINFSFGGSYEKSDGISKADKKEEEEKEKLEPDSYNNLTFSNRISFQPLKSIDFDLIFRYTDVNQDRDDGSFEDDPNYILGAKQSTGGFQFSHTPTKIWNHKLILGINKIEREYADSTDEIDTLELLDSWYKGDNLNAEWHHCLSPSPLLTIVGGVEYEKEAGESYYHSEGPWGPYTSEFKRKEITNSGGFIEFEPNYQNLFLTLGGRADIHKEFGSHFTQQASLAYLFPELDTKIKANYATGFKAPTLFQLYSPYGDTTLRPQISCGYDLGIEQWFRKTSLELIFFRNHFKELITSDPQTYKYKNIAKAESHGFEVTFKFEPFKSLRGEINYTGTYTRDEEGKELLRRPAHKYRASINYHFLGKGNLCLKVLRVGPREDISWVGFEKKRVTLPIYTKVDLASSWRVWEKVKLKLRIENLLNENYQEVYGYQTPRGSVYGGAELAL